jgi:hypothetical protein
MFFEFDGDFTIGEATDIGSAEINVQLACDVGGQFGIGVASENHQAVKGHAHIPPGIFAMYARFARHNENRAGL